jgi:vacuolar-type H+-ATPase subunit I/STV1
MGNLVWHEYSRFVSITASVYGIWAAFWGLFYRKFFWDFIGGTIRTPGGIQPSPNVALFVTLIVRAPVIQIFTMIVAFIILAIEFPLPFIKGRAIHRSIPLRIVMLVFQASLAILFYQGTNCAIWSLIAAGCYGRAQALGEIMEDAKANKGKVERA